MMNALPTSPAQHPEGHQPPRIAVQLHGGLGNQLFQAAAGLALAKRMRGRLIFDLSRFRAGGLRGYALAPFGLEAEIRLAQTGIGAQARRFLNHLRGEKHRPLWWGGSIFREVSYHYDARFETLGSEVLLAGYFQSPRYFCEAEAEIRAAFSPRKLASVKALALAAEMASEESASLHLRRGDYAKDAKAAAIHGVLGWDYYDKAVAHLRARLPQARLFILSDDESAAQEAASRWPNAQAIWGENAGDDFFLLSQARHHILANSTFSWWSAYLDSREDSIKIVPRAWFAQQESGQSDMTKDLIPQNWICL